MEETIDVIEEVDETEIELEEEPIVIGKFPSGTINITNNGEYDVENYKNANVDVHLPPNLQDKSISISSNGQSTIQADEGYDGLNTVSLNVNITDFPKVELPDGICFRSSTSTDMSFLSGCNTTNVITMNTTFGYCYNIVNLDLKHFNVENLKDIRYLFTDCTNLTTLDLSNWNTIKLNTLVYSFNSCRNLVNLNIDNWKLSQITSTDNLNNMFMGCNSLSNESLNSILKALATNTRSLSNKTLKKIGLNSTQANTCTQLSNWQSCVNAGWTTGY